MTNEERRLALAKARRKALEMAELSDVYYSKGDTGYCREAVAQAAMWAAVAEAMKTGGALEADGVIPDPPGLVGDDFGHPIITR